MIDPMSTTALMRHTWALILAGWSVMGFLVGVAFAIGRNVRLLKIRPRMIFRHALAALRVGASTGAAAG